jgi:hypothetical protein
MQLMLQGHDTLIAPVSWTTTLQDSPPLHSLANLFSLTQTRSNTKNLFPDSSLWKKKHSMIEIRVEWHGAP